MDKDSLIQIIKSVNENSMQTTQINWEPILWTAGVVVTIIGGLLTWIGILIKADRNSFIETQIKHESWILKNQEDLKELAIETRESIAQNRTAVEFIKEYLIKKK